MTEAELYPWLVRGLVGIGVVTFLVLLFVSAPYGRHERPGWGPTISNRVGWLFMEGVSPAVFAAVYAQGSHAGEAAPLVFLGMWQLHYLYRAFVFPFRVRSPARPMPALVALLGMAFNALNAYLNARWVSELGSYAADWLTQPLFLTGAAVFVTGWAVNHHADHVLLHLRKPGETGYKIPRGGLYRWVTCPNYLGELVEWCGFALAAASPAGAAFAWYTAANLVPRALTHHRWYREKFADYPPERKAILPGLL